MTNIAQELIDVQERLKADLATYHSHCEEVARYVVPRLDDFFNARRVPGEKRSQYQYDSTAPLALDRFASIVESLVVPRGQLWHGLEPEDEELLEDHEAMLWYESVRNYLFKLRYGTTSNFAPQVNETFSSMGAFGCGVMITEERPGQWLRYKSSHIKEHYFQENSDGIIDSDYREYELTARQAVQKFGEANLSERMLKCVSKEPNRKFKFLHVVIPNGERVYGAIDARGKAFSSYHISVEDKMMVAKPGGYRKFPFIVARYMTSPNEVMGRSPAMTALAEIKMLNQIRKTDIKARHLAIDPPNLAANEASIRKFNLKPNAMNYGTLDMAGNPLVKPYQTGTRIDMSNDMIDQSRRMINDIFLVNLFQILIETPEMTATEVLARQQEKGDLLSPIGGRLENEFCGKLVERELDAMAAAGQFDDDGPFPMPASVRERGGAYSVKYTSPMARYRMSGEAAGAEKTVQALIPVAQIDPTVFDIIDFKEYGKLIARATGAPIRIMRSNAQLAAMEEGRRQQQEAEMMAQALPAVAGSVKDLAQAEALTQ